MIRELAMSLFCAIYLDLSRGGKVAEAGIVSLHPKVAEAGCIVEVRTMMLHLRAMFGAYSATNPCAESRSERKLACVM